MLIWYPFLNIMSLMPVIMFALKGSYYRLNTHNGSTTMGGLYEIIFVSIILNSTGGRDK